MSGRCRTKSIAESFAIKRYRDKRYEEQNGKCYFCNRQMYRKEDKGWERYKMQRATAEHLIPVVEGGPHTYDNIVASCHHCNSFRGTLPADVWKDIVGTPKKRRAYIQYLEQIKLQKQCERRSAQTRHFLGVLMVIAAFYRRPTGMESVFNAYGWLLDTENS